MKLCGLFAIVVILSCVVGSSESLGFQKNGEKSKDLQEFIKIFSDFVSVKLRFIKLIMKKLNPNGFKNPPGFTPSTTSSDFDDDTNSNEDNDFDSNSISDSSTTTGFTRFGNDVTESSVKPSTKAPKKSNNQGNDDFGDSLQFSDDVF